MDSQWNKVLRRIDNTSWELPKSFKEGMRVPGIIYANEEMMRSIVSDQSLQQVANVATLPGVVYASLAMPDIHWGYGFPIGGVAATRYPEGVISPGGVGFDINCGVRLLRTDLTEDDIRDRMTHLVDTLYSNIPTGVGSKGELRLNAKDLDRVMVQGARWAVEHGFGDPADIPVTEESGHIAGADPASVGERPRKRGAPQLGTLGSGNHFLEVQVVEAIYDSAAAKTLGITGIGQVTVLIHTGSRGFGHQVCDDYLKVMDQAARKYDIQLPDRQLACAPLDRREGKDYLAAMQCAANFAWANRQVIVHWTRQSFESVLGRSWREMGMSQVYDVTHNIAKVEKHHVNGKQMTLCVHRKGATRSFPAGHREVPSQYQGIGQPVLIPGDMGRYSYLAVGGERSMELSFGSTCHGAGRTRSRSQAKKLLKGRDIRQELEERGIIVRASGGWRSLAEEASEAYKDVADVVETAHDAGLSKMVARMRPLGVIKG